MTGRLHYYSDAQLDAVADRLVFLEERAERAERQRDAWKAAALSARATVAKMLASSEPRAAVALVEDLALCGGALGRLAQLSTSLPTGPVRAALVARYAEAWWRFGELAADYVATGGA